jgi:hypothetical protein
MRFWFAVVLFAVLMLLGGANFALGDGTDPMPACRGIVCPPLYLNH